MTAPLSVAEVLERAADLIEPEGAWAQKSWARDMFGSPDAIPGEEVCWCLWGSIYKISGYEFYVTDAAINHVMGVVGDPPITWNDAAERTQAEVVAALREAAKKAREEAQ